MKRNIPKNYNKPGKYGFCTLSSAGVLCYGADIRRCRLLLWYDVNYKSLILSIDYCLEFLSLMYSIKTWNAQNFCTVVFTNKFFLFLGNFS